MSKHIKYITIATLVGYILFSAFVIKHEERKQLCSVIKLSLLNAPKNPLVTQNSILDLIAKNNLHILNADWNDININKIKQIIDKHPAVKKSACIRTPNNKLEIKILQYKPVVRILTDQSNFYISEDKTIIPYKESAPALVLVASGAISNDFALNNIFPIANYITNNPFWNAQIQQIYVNKAGELILTPRVGQQTILFGDSKNYLRKFSYLKALYEQGFSKTGWNKYKEINLKYENQVICTRAQ